jgi:hypothetical protein
MKQGLKEEATRRTTGGGEAGTKWGVMVWLMEEESNQDEKQEP